MLKAIITAARAATALNQIFVAAGAAIFITHGVYRLFKKPKRS